MPFPFDATLKHLAQDSPRAFLTTFDAPPTLPATLLNVDLSTVSTAADIVFGLGDPLAEIVHLDCQSSAAEDLHRDVLVLNALLHRRYHVPVHSIVVLLRPKARHRNLDGSVRYQARPGRGKMDFGFEVVELWRKPVTELLAGELGTVPLAVLGQLAEDVAPEVGLPNVIARLLKRLDQEAEPGQVKKLVTAAYVLSGLRVERSLARELFRGARAMRDSDTFQAILDEGREEGIIKGVQQTLLRQGRKRFGEPDAAALALIKSISDLDRLEWLSERLLDVSGWQELLEVP